MPLIAADHAWSARYLYAPAAHVFLDSTLCVSATEVWVESARRAWRDEDPPERVATGRLKLRDIMPIDYMPVREIELPPGVSRATVKPYRERLQGLLEADRVHEMISRATYAIERQVPDDELLLADRIWFGRERPFRSAREALARLEDELADWETELEAERCALAQSILGIEMGDIVAAENRGRFLRLSVTGITPLRERQRRHVHHQWHAVSQGWHIGKTAGHVESAFRGRQMTGIFAQAYRRYHPQMARKWLLRAPISVIYDAGGRSRYRLPTETVLDWRHSGRH